MQERECGRFLDAAIWKIVLSCLMWCLWRKRNDRCFEDRERMMGDLKDFFLKTLYLWTTAFNCNISSFYVFLELFSSPS
jgi:hypothetical protein